METKLEITKEFCFDAAHKLYSLELSEETNRDCFGDCCNLHGHLYKLFVTVSAPSLLNGMLINFVELKKIVTDLIIKRFDHKYLNDDKLYSGIRLTTCENMIQDIWDILASAFHEGIILEELKLYETPTSYATLRRCSK